jgi:hypothetical protein
MNIGHGLVDHGAEILVLPVTPALAEQDVDGLLPPRRSQRRAAPSVSRPATLARITGLNLTGRFLTCV